MSQVPQNRPTALSANEGAPPHEGIALRDWMAGQALNGMIPMPRQPGVLQLDMEGMAKAAYAYADAMMIARSAGRS